MQFHVGPGGAVELPVEVDYRQSFEGSNFADWEQEYETNVRVAQTTPLFGQRRIFGSEKFETTEEEFEEWAEAWEDYMAADWSPAVTEDTDDA